MKFGEESEYWLIACLLWHCKSTYEIFIKMYNLDKLDNKCTKFELHMLSYS